MRLHSIPAKKARTIRIMKIAQKVVGGKGLFVV